MGAVDDGEQATLSCRHDGAQRLLHPLSLFLGSLVVIGGGSFAMYVRQDRKATAAATLKRRDVATPPRTGD